jgi:hypothetical protein
MSSLLAALRTVAFGHLPTYATRAVAHFPAVATAGCQLKLIAHDRSFLLMAAAYRTMQIRTFRSV